MPKKTYFVTVLGEQEVDGQTIETKVAVPCRFEVKGKFGLISYDEHIEMEKVSSKIKIYGPKSIIIAREGRQSAKLKLEEGEHHVCTYGTEFGALRLGVFTHKINCNMSQNGCSIQLEYSLDTNDVILSKNKVIINVKEANDVESSIKSN